MIGGPTRFLPRGKRTLREHNLFYPSKDLEESMTGGGLIGLTKYGSQNVQLSGNPQMTYFYKLYKKYSHFAMESITLPLEGPNELAYDQPITLRTKISRFGDLLSDVYFTFRIPDIYSKYDPARAAQFEFQWVRYLGAALIQSAGFYVGGQKIQEVDGSYLVAKSILDRDLDNFQKWQKLVGDVPELTDPAKGLYAGGSTGSGYPSVVKDPTAATQLNRPSIAGQEIHVPLSFWFTDDPSQSVPLVGLQYHDCEVRLILNPISFLYTILDVNGNRVNPNFACTSTQSENTLNLPTYATAPDLTGQIRNFVTDFGTSAPPLNGWNLNPRLQATYIYLAKEEQQVFATRPVSYLFSQMTSYPLYGIYNRQLYDLQVHNPITRLLFVQRRSDSQQRNDFANFTNWAFNPKTPFLPTPGINPSLQAAGSSGILLPNGQREMIRALRVLCDGNEIQEQKPVDYFTKIVPFRYMKGLDDEQIPVYTFELRGPGVQPSGSINASLIRNFQVEIDVYPLPPATTYVYDITVYVENINWFEVASGMGGLKYAL